jgi:hypothetical protein
MGLIYSHAALLAQARQNGVCFDTTLTLGRQSSYLKERHYSKLAKRCGCDINSRALSQQQYADEFFKSVLGAKKLSSLDYSDYEGCDIVHDMNQPVPAVWHEKYDVVIDGGFLEHVFHFPTAISNCMNMVKEGGSLFIFTTANNFLGHGFYQFSPELFFRIFDSKSGFEIKNMLLEEHPFPGVELTSRATTYAVADPASLQERVALVSKRPVLLLVHAIRKQVRPALATYPIQSDYASIFANKAGAKPVFAKALGEKLLRYLPVAWGHYLIGKYQLRRYSFLNRHFYKKRRPL